MMGAGVTEQLYVGLSAAAGTAQWPLAAVAAQAALALRTAPLVHWRPRESSLTLLSLPTQRFRMEFEGPPLKPRC